MTETNGIANGEPSSSASHTEHQPAAAANATSLDHKTDTSDSGSKKPRDARIIHLILASMGVSAYEERVPLMLMDFAYRYTSSVLQDALLFSDAVYGTANTGGQNPPANISGDDLRMSIASRINHQFNTSLPKEFLLDIAQERNRVALPTVGQEFGVRLPPEKYCLTGINWDLAEGGEWIEVTDDEEEEDTHMLLEPKIEDAEEGKMEVDDLFGGGDGDSNMADA